MSVFDSTGARKRSLANAGEDGTRRFTYSATCAFCSNFFALDQLAQSAPHQKGLFHGGTFGWITALQVESREFDSLWCHWNFSMTYSYGSHYEPGVDSGSNRNEYQEYSLGSKGGRWIGLTTLILSCGHYLEIWELQPPGSLRAFPWLYRYCFHFITKFLWMEYLNVLKARKETCWRGNRNSWAVCVRVQSMEDLSFATVYYMIIDVINGRMLQYYLIASLNFT